MPTPVRLTKRQLARLTGQTEAEGREVPAKRTGRPHSTRKQVEAHKSTPAVGKHYRVARSLRELFDNPPSVGCECEIIEIGRNDYLYLFCGNLLFTVREETLREFFEEVE